VIDGGEGCGKTSVISFLKDNLPHEDFVFTREPVTPPAEMIRNVMISPEAKDASGETQFGLIWASRSEHLRRLVEPTLVLGKNVISDRFDSSTYAYQLHGQESQHLRNLFFAVREQFVGKNEPDLYIILDLPIEVAEQRIKNRKQQSNHFDEQSREYHERVREGYLDFVKDKKHKIIDAVKPLEEVCAEVFTTIKELTV
jgi:dTMP kinase